MALPDGLYDLLLTEGLAQSLSGLDPLDADVLALERGAAGFLADVITRQLAAILDGVTGDDSDKVRHQLELVNGLLISLRQRLQAGDGSGAPSASAEVVDLVVPPLRILRAVQRGQGFPTSPEVVRISAIVDAHFRLIVDGESSSSWRRWGSAQELV